MLYKEPRNVEEHSAKMSSHEKQQGLISNNYTSHESSHFTSLRRTRVPSAAFVMRNTIIAMLIFGANIIAFTPFQQTSFGLGRVVAYNPMERVQFITAMTSGIIKQWYVKEGQFVKQGAPILELIDTDTERLTRLHDKLSAIKMQYDNAKHAEETSKTNRDRQYRLWKEGITSRKNYEAAQIAYKKLVGYKSEIASKVLGVETELARQKAQIITAPSDGHILRVSENSTSSYISSGKALVTFAPKVGQYAVELFLNASDAFLVYPGRKVRLIFDGWPAFQFNAWPDGISIGTFAGIIKSVDSVIPPEGKFRVIILPDVNARVWPSEKYLRAGGKVQGWVILNQVSLGYEIWRRMNNFPMLPDFLYQSRYDIKSNTISPVIPISPIKNSKYAAEQAKAQKSKGK